MKPFFKKIAAIPLLLLPAISFAQFTDNFSTPAAWSQIGTTVNVSGGYGNFSNSPCASDQRIYRQLSPTNATLHNSTWTADIDFQASQPGSSMGAAHSVVCFTAGNLNPYRYTPTGAYTPQDFIEIAYSSPMYTGFSQWKLYANLKDGANANVMSTNGIVLPAQNTWYYLRLQRNVNTLTLSAFSDAARTIHLTGSPVTLAILGTVDNLSHVQVGSIIHGASTRRINGKVDNLNVTGLTNGGNCDFWEDYSAVGTWAQVNTLVTVDAANSNQVDFSAAIDGNNTQRRVHHTLNGVLNGVNTWKADFDFLPTAVGNGGPGHCLLATTAGILDPFCDNLYNATIQDAIAAYWGSTDHSANPATFMLDGRAKNDNNAWSTSAGILLAVNTQYYITLERLDLTHGRISAYLDAARTIIVGIQCFVIPAGVTSNLTSVQHGTVPWGGNDRSLTGVIDNTCITASTINPGSISYNGPAYFCTSGTPGLLDNASPAFGGFWNWTYQWEQSTGCNGIWVSIVGATNLTYTAPSINNNTCYRRAAYGPCGVVLYSNTISIIVYQPLSTSISLTSGGPSSCNNTGTLSASINNPQGVTYSWSTGATTSSIVVNPSVQTVYSVTVTNPCYSATASYTYTPCYSPTGSSFPLWDPNNPLTTGLQGANGFCVNWSGNCTGSCYLQVKDATMPLYGIHAYGATKGTFRVFNRDNPTTMVFEQIVYGDCNGLWNGVFVWDGIYQGQPVPVSVYDYYVKLENCDRNDPAPEFGANDNAWYVFGAVSVMGTCRFGDPDAVDSSQSVSPASGQQLNATTIFPNPGNGNFTINFDPSTRSGDIKITVTDVTGRIVKEEMITADKNAIDLDLTGNSKGIYYLRLSDGENVRVEKLVIQ